MSDEIGNLQDRFAAASAHLTGACGDMLVRGYSSMPSYTVAAIAEVEAVLARMRKAGMADDGLLDVGREDLLDDVKELSGHTCSCPFCIHGVHAP